MNKTLRQILGVMLFFIICEIHHNAFAHEDELDIGDFFGRVLPLSQRHDRTQDQLCLKIKNDVRYYIRHHGDQPLLPNAIPFSKNEYIQREGISKIFKSLLEEPSSLKMLQLRDLYRLSNCEEEERRCDDLVLVLFNLENGAHPFADFPITHPFGQRYAWDQIFHETLQTFIYSGRGVAPSA